MAKHVPERLLSLVVGGADAYAKPVGAEPGPLLKIFRPGAQEGVEAVVEDMRARASDRLRLSMRSDCEVLTCRRWSPLGKISNLRDLAWKTTCSKSNCRVCSTPVTPMSGLTDLGKKWLPRCPMPVSIPFLVSITLTQPTPWKKSCPKYWRSSPMWKKAEQANQQKCYPCGWSQQLGGVDAPADRRQNIPPSASRIRACSWVTCLGCYHCLCLCNSCVQDR